MCMKLSGNGRQTRVFIKQTIFLVCLFIYVFIMHDLYNDPVSGFV